MERVSGEVSMIIEIDGHFFNPLLIRELIETKDADRKVIDTRIWFDDNHYIVLDGWTAYNLAARINELIEEFNRK
jgi:hypothetical protein